MKRGLVLCLALVFIVLNVQAVGAQEDMCHPDTVVASFYNALKDLEPWIQSYAESDCSPQIRNGARMLAAAYLAMGSEYISFSAPDNPEELNPVLGWQPGSSNVNSYDLAMEPGALTLIAGMGTDQWQNTDSAPLVIYPFEGDFDAQVRVMLSPSGNTAKVAGLGIRAPQNHNTWLRIVRAWVDDGLTVRAQANQQGNSARLNFVTYSGDTTYLRIERNGPLFTLSYSENGSNWIALVQDHVFEMPDDVEIYLITFSTASNEGALAQFHDFSVSQR